MLLPDCLWKFSERCSARAIWRSANGCRLSDILLTLELNETNKKRLGGVLRIYTTPGQAPKQPLMATRSLQKVIKTAISRATTDDRYASAAGLILPACPFGNPPLEAVVRAATCATAHICRLLECKADAWPMREFAVVVSSVDQSGDVDDHRKKVAFVQGAARPAVGEQLRSPQFCLPHTLFIDLYSYE